MEQDDDNDVRDLSDDDVDHQEEMDGDDESLDDVEKVNDLDFIAQHAAEPWVFSSDVSKEVITTGKTEVAVAVAVAGNNEVIEMNQSDDESEEEELDVMAKYNAIDNESSSDDESDILEMERKNTTKDSYTSHKTEVTNWLTEEEENIPSGPPRTRNEVDEIYDVFDPNELDLAGRPILSTLLSSYHLCIYLTSHPRCVYLYHQTLLPIFMKYYLHLPPRLPTSRVILPQQRILLRFDQ